MICCLCFLSRRVFVRLFFVNKPTFRFDLGRSYTYVPTYVRRSILFYFYLIQIYFLINHDPIHTGMYVCIYCYGSWYMENIAMVPVRYGRNSTICVFSYHDIHHKIVRQQKKLKRYENMAVFFTVTRSFYYWCTIILKILLFVVCSVVFLLPVMSVYVLWKFHNLRQIRTLHYRT